MAQQEVPWLFVEGPKASEAAMFYKSAFGAVEVDRFSTFYQNLDFFYITSIELKLRGLTFMVADMVNVASTPDVLRSPVNKLLVVSMETDKDVSAAFLDALKAGAKHVLPLVRSEGKGRTTMVRDPYGFVWTFTSPLKK